MQPILRLSNSVLYGHKGRCSLNDVLRKARKVFASTYNDINDCGRHCSPDGELE